MQQFAPLLPPIVALILILITRKAALSLSAAALTGVLLIHNFHPITSLTSLVSEHLLPSLSSTWNFHAILFTLLLGAFATVLEKGGGFQALLHRFLSPGAKNPKQKLLFGIYGLGLLCFFDGLANAILLGRVSRSLTDTLRISRQFLAYLIDSTAACVACVAFISTWIATQLSLIDEGIADSAIDASPAALFFSSIPANPYCLLTLFLIPLVILKSWHPGPMAKANPEPIPESPTQAPTDLKARTSLIPLASLVLFIPGVIYLWQDGPRDTWSWQNAFSSTHVPHAMTLASLLALITACLCFPKKQRPQLPTHLLKGAASLIPALLILIAAWTLGSTFKELGTAQLLSNLLSNSINLAYLPLAIFLLGATTSFLTGTSWGTMGLLMPIVVPLAINLGATVETLPLTIGAVFGGAVFGDHCSPFSDTTIVSSLAAGCTPTSHVITQLPYALITAGAAALAYLLIALSIPAPIATLILAASLAALVLTRKSTNQIPNTPEPRLE